MLQIVSAVPKAMTAMTDPLSSHVSFAQVK